MSNERRVQLEPAVVKVEAQPLRLAMRVFFSMYQLWASRHLAAEARDIENGHDPTTDEPRFDIKHRANVMMSIIASATFIESFVNEVFEDLATGQGKVPGRYDTISPRAQQIIKQYWQVQGDRDRTLWKYQMLLIACDSPTMDAGSAPYQDAQLLLELRNKLIHYRPETLFADEDYKLQQKLRGKFVDCVLLSGSGNPWWPDHCLGFGCAEWAERSVLALTDHVVDALKINPPYRMVDFGDPLRDS
jgi:hypothetical protein